MTKQRDRYQSGFDETVPGVRSAVYDIGLALYMLKEIAEKYELMRERFTFSRSGESWTVAQILEIARGALMTSVSPVTLIYERLQQNADAAAVMAKVSDMGSTWSSIDRVFQETLNNKAIISRGYVTKCRREIERRAKAKAKTAKETGGDGA